MQPELGHSSTGLWGFVSGPVLVQQSKRRCLRAAKTGPDLGILPGSFKASPDKYFVSNKYLVHLY